MAEDNKDVDKAVNETPNKNFPNSRTNEPTPSSKPGEPDKVTNTGGSETATQSVPDGGKDG